ncbi:hypothetical protein ACFFRR_000579 [Megaselia abdita]
MGDYNWVSTNVYSDVPCEAVVAGHDSDGALIYVARAYHSGDVLPAKYVPDRQEAYVPFGGQEVRKNDIEVLVGTNFGWAPASCGSVPELAVRCGTTSDGEPLYVGRGHWESSLTPGKIHPSHGCLYLPYGGQEQRMDNYEVLVEREQWVQCDINSIPPNAFPAGHDSDGTPIFVGRAYHSGDMLPAKVVPTKNKAYVAFGGVEHEKYDIEVLTGGGCLHWVSGGNGYVPPNAIEAGNTSDGEPLYIGRGHYHGSLTPGKVHPSHGCLYIPYGGAEHRLSDYEVLCKH